MKSTITAAMYCMLLSIILFSCSKTKEISTKGQIIEIANWEDNKTGLGLSKVKVCMITYTTGQSIGFGGGRKTINQEKCAYTDDKGNFNITMEVNRKAYRQQSSLVYVPDQPGFEVRNDYADSRNVGFLQKERGIFTMAVKKYFPIVLTLNNVNYLNDRDSLLLDGSGAKKELIYMGKQSNTQVRGIFYGKKNSANPAYVGGHAYIVYRNGIRVFKENFNYGKIVLQGDTGYYTINY